jgi:hypothetical protein
MFMREEKLSTRLETSASAFCSSDFCFCTAAAAAAAVGPGAEPAAPPTLLIARVVAAARGRAQRRPEGMPELEKIWPAVLD